VRCEDGTVLRHTFGAEEPLAAAAALVAATRGEAEGPFTLLTPFPRCEYATEAQLQTTLRQAQLVPRGTLLVLSDRSRGVVHQGASAQSAQREQLQGHLAHLQQMLGELQAAQGPGEDAGYEQLLAWEESMGGAVAAGLTATELRRLRARTVTAEDEDAPDASPCCICCCEFVAGDHLMALGCGHEFHHECVSRWLRAKRFCPMCKAPVGGTGAMAPPEAAAEGGGDDE